MSSQKYFENPFPDIPSDYSDLIDNGQIKANHRLKVGLDKKWHDTIHRYQNMDCNDTSVYTGTSGIALLMLKKDPDSKQNLEYVKRLLGLSKLKAKRCTFLCGDAGPLAIGAVVEFKLGNMNASKELANQLMSMHNDVFNTGTDMPNELLYGRAGFLFALLYINKNVSPPCFDDNYIRKVIETIFLCGKNEAKAGKFKCPLMYQWHDSYYLGAAHGLSGILYLFLQIKDYLTETELQTLIKPTIDYLATLRFPSGNFPSSLGRDSDKYVQWCHGAPGFVYLFSAAYKVFADPNYLQIALEAGDVIWKRGLVRKGYSICHGVSGNAYCFLELFQTTKDEKHLYRAICFAEWCFDYRRSLEEHKPDRPLSLYEGISGPMYLLLDMQDPLEAKFPGFTL